MNRYLTLGLLLLCINCVLAQYPRRKPPQKVPEIDQTCLNCLCEASSNCDESLKCHNSAGGGYFCGPYVISWAYWHDGGRPGDRGKPHDFENCLTNKTCAEEAVRNYMRKYGRDCDDNKYIDCYDFSLIHKLGFGSCNNEAAIYGTDYFNKFEDCINGRKSNDNNNDERNNNDGTYDGDRNDDNEGQGDFVDYGEGHINGRRTGQQG